MWLCVNSNVTGGAGREFDFGAQIGAYSIQGERGPFHPCTHGFQGYRVYFEGSLGKYAFIL